MRAERRRGDRYTGSKAAHAAFIARQSGSTLAVALDAALAIDPEFDFVAQRHARIAASAITGTAAGTARAWRPQPAAAVSDSAALRVFT
ncbi:hypothetical protein [Burkholderia ubonensis]|uniref:hypothetical protein n=1 Tax=Burkholderia ubonensis TaxID=101571 RepID=UPI00075737EC|nr:hypothetical protein [Burkholderia ubonensis]KWB42342.1 hypothetical protein WL36_22825 [Burkholderia ubonensis]